MPVKHSELAMRIDGVVVASFQVLRSSLWKLRSAGSVDYRRGVLEGSILAISAMDDCSIEQAIAVVERLAGEPIDLAIIPESWLPLFKFPRFVAA